MRGRNVIERWDAALERWVPLDTVPSAEVWVSDGGLSSIPYAPEPLWAATRDGGFWYADSGEARVSRHAPDGEAQCQLTLDLEPVEVSAAERRAFYDAEDVAARAPDRAPQVRQMRRGVPVPDVKPPVAALFAPASGGLWVKTAQAESDASRASPARWLVFGDGSEPAQVVSVPSSFSPRAVHAGRVWGIETDTLNVPYAVAYRLP